MLKEVTVKTFDVILRQKDRKTEKIDCYTQTEGRHIGRQRQKDRKTERQKDRKTERQKDRKTERQNQRTYKNMS